MSKYSAPAGKPSDPSACIGTTQGLTFIRNSYGRIFELLLKIMDEIGYFNLRLIFLYLAILNFDLLIPRFKLILS